MRSKVQREMGAAGGRPALRDHVLGFVQRLIFRERGAASTDDGDLFWPTLFFLLRCGANVSDVREFMYDSRFRRFASRVETEIGRTDADADQAKGYDGIFCLLELFVSRNAGGPRAAAGAPTTLTPAQAGALATVRRLKARWAKNRAPDWTTPYMDAVLNLICHFDSWAPLRTPGRTLEDAMWQKICFILAPAAGGGAGAAGAGGAVAGALAPGSAALQDQSSVPYTLRDLSAWVLRQDRDRFRPEVYFNALLLCLEFEEAVGFLAALGTSPAAPFKDVVHFAVALHHYGALRTPGPETDLRTVRASHDRPSYCVRVAVPPNLPGCDANPNRGAGSARSGPNNVTVGSPVPTMPVLRFEALIRDYARTFERTEPDKACEYLLLLRAEAGGRSRVRDGALHAIAEVVLVSGCFDHLLGDEQGRSKGYLNRTEQPRLDAEEFRDVVDRAARRAMDKEGQHLQAVSLYLRIGAHRHVVSILCGQLARVCTAPTHSATATGQAVGYARRRASTRACAERFVVAHVVDSPEVQQAIGWTGGAADGTEAAIASHGGSSGGREGRALQTLMYVLMPFFDLCAESKWRAALRALEPFDLLPRTDGALSRCAEKFEHAGEAIRRNVHHVLLGKMEALYSLHLQAKRGSYAASAPVTVDLGGAVAQPPPNALQVERAQWRQEARLLVVFANLLPCSHNFALPDNVRAQLFRMQVDMET
jgi:hypothetical protein